jgi:hypothetical protein
MADRNLRKNRKDRCLLCGVRTTLHFTADNRKISCQETTEAHPRASVLAIDLSSALRASLEVAR